MVNRIALFILLLLSVSACTSHRHQPAPVMELSASNESKIKIHIVRSGETLYEIAWIYDYDYRDLATVNRLSYPYPIIPGQKIEIKKPSSVQKIAAALQKPEPQVAPTKSPTDLNHHETIKTNAWIWPAKGKILKSYSLNAQSLNKGIDISGKLNTPVLAAQAGKVVYSGSGLRGYGKLVILKHNEDYLSAYGHNSELLVKEGDLIQQGQIIAKMGYIDDKNVALHFEIRYQGQPVNPLNYTLPN